jgi:hypothetical protein
VAYAPVAGIGETAWFHPGRFVNSRLQVAIPAARKTPPSGGVFAGVIKAMTVIERIVEYLLEEDQEILLGFVGDK